MNLKPALLLPGAIALLLSATTIMPAIAQVQPTQAPQVQQQKVKLNLTAEQKTKLKAIRESTRSQIDAILTADQRAKLNAGRQQRQKNRELMASLNLSPEQKEKIKAIRQDAKRQMDEVLTPEQRQQLEQNRRQRSAR